MTSFISNKTLAIIGGVIVSVILPNILFEDESDIIEIVEPINETTQEGDTDDR